ncbi:DUF2612 domain-containing protein [Burkholderia cepacia]|uniref:DUF2612 domain-containing protein n=1 Tax=Burkholderia cepacia TaxID=292 RepID=A0ABN5D261_BURCE|nr:DUF2612 domain-containing protein [Burkholderia cepacia]AIO24492.1 hypothetical protein DM41_2991 [Burkholderia cepacia ATCC 25416]ALK18530.1 hypothetical protein APZ15_12335 [Burkholderia cepacia ATCC 25416]ASE95994.1 DUF2612 domain-containing protein [Burkholderia cepacia]ATF79003.1 DUF2612 domain-containing protein [Burkholderia cepacia]MCA8466857.1 DUF2612 domain-containing protein [Burkholderia cepacia]
MAELNDYTALITSEHSDKPKFMAVVEMLSAPLVDLMNVLGGMPSLFDLDVAVGDQLDVLGQWIGLSRYVSTPLTGVYFSFDVGGLGFDQGVWKGPFDPDTGLVSLDDDTYRMTLRAKIAANRWDSTPEAAADILDSLAPAGTLVFLEDPCDMSITIGIAGKQPPALYIALLKNGFLSLKPEAVRVNYAVTSVDGAPIFGFDMDNQYVAGFDAGAWSAETLAAPNELDYTFALDNSTLS